MNCAISASRWFSSMRGMGAPLKMQINKNDQNDAKGLAQVIRNDWYRSVQVKSFDSHRARAILSARTQLVGMTTRLSNHIRRMLKTFGLLPVAMRGLPLIGRSRFCLRVVPTSPRLSGPCLSPGGNCAYRSRLSTRQSAT